MEVGEEEIKEIVAEQSTGTRETSKVELPEVPTTEPVGEDEPASKKHRSGEEEKL